MENQETLKSSTLISQFPNSIKNKVHNLLSNGVVSSGVVVGCILLASDQLFGVEKLPVDSSPDFVNDSWFQIHENGTWHVLSTSGFGEKSVEAVIPSSNCLVRWHLTIRLDAVFKAVKFPTRISNLRPGLTNVDRNTLPHFCLRMLELGVVQK